MLICPFCFETFPPGVLDDDLPICRECNPAGRMIEAEPLEEFLHKLLQNRPGNCQDVLGRTQGYVAGRKIADPG